MGGARDALGAKAVKRETNASCGKRVGEKTSSNLRRFPFRKALLLIGIYFLPLPYLV